MTAKLYRSVLGLIDDCPETRPFQPFGFRYPREPIRCVPIQFPSMADNLNQTAVPVNTFFAFPKEKGTPL